MLSLLIEEVVIRINSVNIEKDDKNLGKAQPWASALPNLLAFNYSWFYSWFGVMTRSQVYSLSSSSEM